MSLFFPSGLTSVLTGHSYTVTVTPKTAQASALLLSPAATLQVFFSWNTNSSGNITFSLQPSDGSIVSKGNAVIPGASFTAFGSYSIDNGIIKGINFELGSTLASFRVTSVQFLPPNFSGCVSSPPAYGLAVTFSEVVPLANLTKALSSTGQFVTLTSVKGQASISASANTAAIAAKGNLVSSVTWWRFF